MVVGPYVERKNVVKDMEMKGGPKHKLSRTKKGKGGSQKQRLRWAKKVGHISRKVLVLGNHKLAAGQHTGGEVRGVKRGAVEVLEHSIRLPPAQKADNQRVDIGTK
jgi:hypothetical protein